ncbi:MAG: lipase family protein [Anaerolineales bacterium]|nr:lipase family protein [Anaerolineales bacterium]
MEEKTNSMNMADKEANSISPEELARARKFFASNGPLLETAVKRAAYSDRTAWVMASMAQLVYEHFDDGGKTRELFVQKLKGGGFDLLNEFNNKDTDTQAILVSNGEYAVLAFRGTEVSKRIDILTDAKAGKISMIEGMVHKGFVGAYKSIEGEVLRAVEKLDGIPLYITGHSLGAALATVATQYLERHRKIRDQIAACYTFGSPRVGNNQFDRDFKSTIYRVINTTDIVTVIPLLAMGYIHVGDVRFLEPGMGDIRRGVPILQRIFFFFVTMFRWFGPLVGDHSIALYRKKLEAIAQDRNRDLFYDDYAGGK